VAELEYVLGTHDDEVIRLGVQHGLWRSQAMEGWRRGGFSAGHTLLDIGSGPGYASADLAEIVGPRGRVIAIDQSERFLSSLNARGMANITTHQLDLDRGALPDVYADGAWVRWVFAFVAKPRDLVRRIARAVKPGGSVVIHEYFDYRTWRFMPRSPLFEDFVSVVMRSWRARGGEPDIAVSLPAWLEEEGFRIASLRPMVHVITRDDALWQWPRTFLDTGLARLIDLGDLTADRAEAIRAEFAHREADPHTRMVTPGVMEIVAYSEP
jgi:SAM-dependent methyltransferase